MPASRGPKRRLGRFVLDEEVKTSGNIYYSQWRLAGHQIRQLERLVRSDPEQRKRVRRAPAALSDPRRGVRARRARHGRQAGLRRYRLFLSGRGGPQTGTDLSAQACRDRRRGAQPPSPADGADPVLLRRSRPADRLSQLARRRRRRRRDLPRACRGPGHSPECRLRQEAGRNRDRARRGARGSGAPTGPRNCRRPTQALKAEAEERQAAEAQLRQVQKMEAVGQLTGGIAHDFNNMLAVVVGGIDLARRRLNGPRREVLNHLNNAMEGATRAAALTRRLLSFARSEPLLPERVDSSELVDRNVRPARPHAGRAHPRRGRPRPRRLADLRRPAPARECHRQPRGQRPRRDGGRRRHADHAAATSPSPPTRSATSAPANMCGSASPTPAAE